MLVMDTMLRKILLSIFFVIYLSQESQEVSLFGYHLKVGVPTASQIWKNERETASRIVGGSQVNNVDAVPYMAGLVVRLTTGWTSLCGGALVSNSRVLTAAHCWWDGMSQANLFTVVLGSVTIFAGGTRIETTDITVHPSWNPDTLLNDIAVIKINAVAFSNTIQAIPLPTMADINLDFMGFTGTAVGYGKNSDAQNSFPTSTALHQISVTVISNTDCQRSFSLNIHGSYICTSGQGNVGTCEGDSGGPLTVVNNNQRTLVGLVSFGPDGGCQAGLPSVYTRVTTFLPWIQSNL